MVSFCNADWKRSSNLQLWTDDIPGKPIFLGVYKTPMLSSSFPLNESNETSQHVGAVSKPMPLEKECLGPKGWTEPLNIPDPTAARLLSLWNYHLVQGFLEPTIGTPMNQPVWWNGMGLFFVAHVGKRFGSRSIRSILAVGLCLTEAEHWSASIFVDASLNQETAYLSQMITSNLWSELSAPKVEQNGTRTCRCQPAFPPRRSWGRLIWAVAADLALDTVGGLVLDSSWWMWQQLIPRQRMGEAITIGSNT